MGGFSFQIAKKRLPASLCLPRWRAMWLSYSHTSSSLKKGWMLPYGPCVQVVDNEFLPARWWFISNNKWLYTTMYIQLTSYICLLRRVTEFCLSSRFTEVCDVSTWTPESSLTRIHTYIHTYIHKIWAPIISILHQFSAPPSHCSNIHWTLKRFCMSNSQGLSPRRAFRLFQTPLWSHY